VTAALRPRKADPILSAVRAALDTVRDPELDEPITDLGFVTSCTVDDGRVEVRLRLPTAFCAPNFAYLMTADAYDAVAGVNGVRTVDVRLEDHHDSAQINAGVAAQAGFVGTYASEAAAELDDLRMVFRRKAHIACLERASRQLIAAGWELDALPTATLRDLGEPDRSRLRRRRADIGLPTDNSSLLLVDEDGTPIAPELISARLRFARTVRVSIEGNAHFCRGLLTTRYPQAATDQRPRREGEEATA
jgi:metal-sulfur cluster biosynthetic enzyme